ncbi:cofactor-independent phosphoglycerate mutase [Deltaproteobacteria bacterium OttesenSCG-928-K17]|nr:cofactor-independent phosphoglycerate mutase [Deltaproteobacteria bacterium OttesenSCG-928-K17]
MMKPPPGLGEITMKYVLMIGDGMGDRPRPDLGGLTPIEAAPTPNLDFMAQNGLLGLARTVPPGMVPGSDVAIMSLMGYNPEGILSGRGPLEAASQGIETAPDELVFRLNLVTVEHAGPSVFMRSHAAGNISTAEALELINALKKELPLLGGQRLFPGVNYRHILTWPAPVPAKLPSIPPHDYRDQDVTAFINDPQAAPLMDLVRASWRVLENHPVNMARKAKGLPPANSIWPWGQGLRPQVKSYKERWGLTGATVSAVDLIKGLGLITGLERLDVPGATGWLDTNYEGKVKTALDALKRLDYVVIHLEAPDEASHQGEMDMKLKAIADFDAKVVGPILKALPEYGEFRVLASCDHHTPVELKTHTADPVPFIIYGNAGDDLKPSGLTYSEKTPNRPA